MYTIAAYDFELGEFCRPNSYEKPTQYVGIPDIPDFDQACELAEKLSRSWDELLAVFDADKLVVSSETGLWDRDYNTPLVIFLAGKRYVEE